MKQKILFFILYIFSFSGALFAQVKSTQNQNGSYSFRNATLTVANRATGAEVFRRNFSDTTSLNGMQELTLPPIPVFLSADIQNGELTGGFLWNTRQYCSVDNPLSEDKQESAETMPESPLFCFSPFNKLEINGKTATYTYCFTYGSSLYSFTLEGKLTITLVRDEPTNTKR